MLGDKRRFPAMLIIPSFDELEEWARHHGVKFSSRKELVRSHQVQSLYQGIVEELNNNLAQFEKLKKVLVVPEELSIADGNADAKHEAAPPTPYRPLQEGNRRALRRVGIAPAQRDFGEAIKPS